MIKIFADPCCNFSGQQLRNLGVELLPYYVKYGDKRYLITTDYDQYTPDEQFKMLAETGLSFERPNLGEWLDLIESWLSKGYDILYIAMTQKITGSGATLAIIQEELSQKYSQQIVTYDTKCCSWGTAYMLQSACILNELGRSIEQIIQELDNIRPRIQNWYLPENGKSWKQAKRGDVDTLENETVFTLLTCDINGIFRPEGEFKNRKDGIDYIKDNFQNSEIYLSFTDDVPEYEKDYLLSLLPIERTHLSELCSPPFTAGTVGKNSIEMAIIKD